MHATICDMISDLVHNSIEADATQITLVLEESDNTLNVEIRDNGKGMSAEILRKAKDPFYTEAGKHRHRRVGLGLPFLFQTAEAIGGQAEIDSKEGAGTTVRFRFNMAHVDLPEFGDFAAAAAALMSYGFDGNLVIRRIVDGREYAVEKRELHEVLGDLNSVDSLQMMKKFLETNEEELNG